MTQASTKLSNSPANAEGIPKNVSENPSNGQMTPEEADSMVKAVMDMLSKTDVYRKKKEAEDLMTSLNPQDQVEVMLAKQMAQTHQAAMDCFEYATQAVNRPEFHQNFLNSANKLTRSFGTQVETLNRYRGKGQQKVTVEHVTVHPGGKAFVGNVTPPLRSPFEEVEG